MESKFKIEASAASLQNRADWLKSPIESPTEKHLFAYGAVSFLVPRDRTFSRMTSEALRSWFMPPILLGQYAIFSVEGAPRAFLAWACLSDEVSAAFTEDPYRPPAPIDWLSGRHIWIMSLVSPYSKNITKSVRKEIECNTFADSISTWRLVKGGREVINYHRQKHNGPLKLSHRTPRVGGQNA